MGNSTSFKKGEVNNPKGRPKGAKDKFKQETKRRIDKVLTQLEETLEADIKTLAERAVSYTHLTLPTILLV